MKRHLRGDRGREFRVLRGLEIWHDGRMHTHRRLWDTYRFPGFRPNPTVQGIFGDPKARVIRLCQKRKRVEEVFGWPKTVGLVRKVKLREVPRVRWLFTFAAAAYSLVRMRNLVAAAT